jgi:DNA repair protein RecO (recombination protein O)
VPVPATETTHALILRSVDVGESDRIVHLLVPEHGRVTAVAKGARRSTSASRARSTCSTTCACRCTAGAEPAIGGSSRRCSCVTTRRCAATPRASRSPAILLELLDRLAPEGGPRRDMERLFRFALDSFEAISTHRPDVALRTILELRALDALGVRPELRRCVGCSRDLAGRAARASTSPTAGPVCGACAVRRSGLVPVHLGHAARARARARARVAQLDRLILSERATREGASGGEPLPALPRRRRAPQPAIPRSHGPRRPRIMRARTREESCRAEEPAKRRRLERMEDLVSLCARRGFIFRPARSTAGSMASGTTVRSAPSSSRT